LISNKDVIFIFIIIIINVAIIIDMILL